MRTFTYLISTLMEAPDPALTRHTEIAETLSEGQTDQVIGESGVWTGCSAQWSVNIASFRGHIYQFYIIPGVTILNIEIRDLGESNLTFS